jgi:pyruvate,water dikinase
MVPEPASAWTAPAVLLSLDEQECEDATRVGNKAATLARLRRAGFPVPPGVVLTAVLLEDIDHELSPSILAALPSIGAAIGPGPWAVRSSGVAEDGRRNSYAGQFDSVLNVANGELSGAILRSLQSRHSNRVQVYGGRVAQPMAILIQPMVQADAAGVAFAVDPLSGERRVILEAVEGLGDRLVAGSATPERWTIDEDGSLGAPADARALDDRGALALGDLVRRVSDHLGSAQDIEWAITDDALWLLQARPITTVPADGGATSIPIEVPPGVWARDSFHEPVPISPFGRIALTEQILKVLPRVFAEFGVLIDRGEVANIGGWTYNRLVPLGAPTPRGGRPPPSLPRWLIALLLRLHPAIRRRSRVARQAIESDLPQAVIRRWWEEWRPEHRADIDRSLGLDLGALSDEELAAELDRRVAMIGHPAHAMVAIAYFIAVYQLVETCRQLLGWEVDRALSLLAGLSTTSTEPGRRLAQLAELARGMPAVTSLLAHADESTPGRLPAIEPEFADAFSSYVAAIGHRAVRYDVLEPTLAERPHLLLKQVGDQLASGYSPENAAASTKRTRMHAAAEARRSLSDRDPRELDRFDRVLAQAEAAYPTWEDRVWWTQSVQTALLRYLALELGRRLAARRQVDRSDDVFYLEAHEAREALLDGSCQHEVVGLRRRQRNWAIAHPGPPGYGGTPAAPPPFDLLPVEARLVNESVLWGFSQFFGTPGSQAEPARLIGTPASAGIFTGTVRVVMGEDQFDRIGVGDVVVCPATSPAWSVIFPSIGAVVSDSGGILSHPAIIAREHGIPAVVGTGNGTAVLFDGQRVTVNGTTGVVAVEAASHLPRETVTTG